MTLYRGLKLISLLYNGEIRLEITWGDLSPHTLLAEWFGALGEHKSTNTSSRKSDMGGLLPQCSAELQAGAEDEPCQGPTLLTSQSPILTTHMDMGHVSPCNALLQMAWKVGNRDEFPKVGATG